MSDFYKPLSKSAETKAIRSELYGKCIKIFQERSPNFWRTTKDVWGFALSCRKSTFFLIINSQLLDWLAAAHRK